MIARWALVAAALLLSLAGCAAFDMRPKGSVIIYGRNDAPGIAWFGLAPADPTQSVGFGPDIGVACLTGSAGTEIVSLDADPGQGGRPERAVGRVQGRADPAVIWVDVAADGSLTSGIGVTPWWTDDPQTCPGG